MVPSVRLWVLVLTTTVAVVVNAYNFPGCPGWPSDDVWQSDLATRLSPDAALHGPFTDPNATVFAECFTQGINAYNISAAGDGVCMHVYGCLFEFCRPDLGYGYNLPEYVLEAMTPDDISVGLLFGQEHDLLVSVKSSGHSSHGSSTARGSLMIWLHSYPTDGTITTNFTDSCGTRFDTVIGVNGGETFDDVTARVANDYLLISATGRTVSLSGGWVQGLGLSPMARMYGLGVDNVVTFDVVLVNGTQVRADACTNPELFWALRGGGGGTFGVVTHIHFQLHPPTQVVVVSWGAQGFPSSNVNNTLYNFAEQWLTFWIEKCPTLDNRWGGFWGLFGTNLIFFGSEDDALDTLINDFDEWFASGLDKSAFEPGVFGTFPPSSSYAVFPSFFELRGGEDANGDPEFTDPTGDAFIFLEFSGSQIVPMDLVVNHPSEVKEFLLSLGLVNGILVGNYFLGGKAMDVPSDATAVNPAIREAIWTVQHAHPLAANMTRAFLANSTTGASYHHHDPTEPDWENAFWGSNYQRLLDIKKTFDPNHRLNCWQCVGYQGPDVWDNVNGTGNITCPALVQAQAAVPSAAPSAIGGIPELSAATANLYGSSLLLVSTAALFFILVMM